MDEVDVLMCDDQDGCVWVNVPSGTGLPGGVCVVMLAEATESGKQQSRD